MKTFALLAWLCLHAGATFAGASPFIEVDPPAAKAAATATYGVDVSARTAIRTLVPSEWSVLVHKDSALPRAVSWQKGVPWVDALKQALSGSDVAVMVDWSSRVVRLRPHDVALREGAVTSPELSATTSATPSPVAASAPVLAPGPADAAPVEQRTAPPSAPPASQVVAAPAASSAVFAPEDLDRIKGTQSMAVTYGVVKPAGHGPLFKAQVVEAARQPDAPAAAHAPLTSATSVSGRPSVASDRAMLPAATHQVKAPEVNVAGGASAGLPPPGREMAFNAPDLHGTFVRVAELHEMHLIYLLDPSLKIPGPLTILGVDPAEDVRLVLRALGARSPVQVEVYRAQRILRVSLAAEEGLAGLRVMERLYEGPLSVPVAAMEPSMAAAASPAAVIMSVTPPPALNVNSSAPVQTVAIGAPAPLPAPSASQPPVAATPSGASNGLGSSHPASQTAPVVNAQPAPDVVLAQPDHSPAPTPQAQPVIRLVVEPGEDLELVLVEFMKREGFELRWQVDGRFEASSRFEGSATTVAGVLRLLLPRLGLSADVKTDAKLVFVRQADPLTDRR